MEKFFQTCSGFDEEEVIDLLLHRYGNLEYIMQTDIETAEKIIAKAKDKEKKEKLNILSILMYGKKMLLITGTNVQYVVIEIT